MAKLKYWKRNIKKNRFEKNGEIVQVGINTIGKGTNAERIEGWVVYGKPSKITHGFKSKIDAIKFANKYLKEHDKY